MYQTRSGEYQYLHLCLWLQQLNMKIWVSSQCYLHFIDKLRLRQGGRDFEDDIFKSIFLNENVQILLKNFSEVCS